MPTKRRKTTLIARPEIDREAVPNVRITYFVIQTFTRHALGVSIDEPFQPNDSDHAMRVFARLKLQKAGVILFSRTGDPGTGDWDDAVIIKQAGKVPGSFTDIMAA